MSSASYPQAHVESALCGGDAARHGSRVSYRDNRCKCEPCNKARAREYNVYWMRRAANGGKPLTVSKVGAVRRLQALMALGWPRRELARRAGYQGDAFALVLNSKRQRLTLDVDRRIVTLYDELSMTHGPSSLSRTRAAKCGWPPPLAWDDETIDDPDARPHGGTNHARKDDVDPVAVDRAVAGDRMRLTRAERFEVVARLRTAGLSLLQIEARTGITKPERYVVRSEAVA